MEIAMDINTALKRLKWLVGKKGNHEDIDAYNSLLGWFEMYNEKQMQAYPIVAKLVINQFILLANKEQNRDARYCVKILEDMVTKPITQWIEDLREQVPLIRFALLTHDFQAELRRLRTIAEHNKIPAEDSETLQDEYQKEDIQAIIEEERNIQEVYDKMVKVPGEEYTTERANKFINDLATRLMSMSNG